MRRPCRFWFVIFVVLAGSRLSVAVLHIFCQVEEKPQEAVVEEKPRPKAVVEQKRRKAVPFWFVSFQS